VAGRCSAPVAVTVDGAPHPTVVVRDRFWATVPVRAGAEVAAGGAVLGRIGEAAPDAPLPGSASLAVCMATFEPDPALFHAQVESLRAQTDPDWVCVVSDDGSSPEHLARIRAELGDDPRFLLSQAPERQGFYRNFERAMRLAPEAAGLIALCDQDDRWHPDKLATLRAALGGAGLVYSDQRLVDAGGRVLRATMWEGRANNHDDLVSMLVANAITGAAMLMRREVAELALPFPDLPAHSFHDAWLSVVALAAGDVAYVDRPLYDYVQHRGAVFGDVTHGAQPPRRRRSAKGAYFRGYLPRAVMAETLLLRGAPKRRELERFVAAERSWAAAAWLAARTLRHHGTTLWGELELLPGLIWRRLAPRLGWDASLPDLGSFEQKRLRRWRARV
jgi:glycosyltransferase involved in cell wall biosynthesis